MAGNVVHSERIDTLREVHSRLSNLRFDYSTRWDGTRRTVGLDDALAVVSSMIIEAARRITETGTDVPIPELNAGDRPAEVLGDR